MADIADLQDMNEEPEMILLPPDQDQLDRFMANVLVIDENLRAAIRNQGILIFNDFIGMEETDITSLTTNIRKPGGTLPRPTRANPDATIPNPGISVGHVITRRLEWLRYYMNHCHRIQRLPVNPAFMNLMRLNEVYTHFKNEKEAPEIDLPGKIVKIDDVRTNIEDLDSYLKNALGQTYLPLAYLVRDSVALPDHDPGFGEPNFHTEMIRRGSHEGPAFQHDNVTLWNVISHMTHGGLAWNWVSRYERTRNGREAYIALKTHYLGASYQNRILAAADAVLSKTYYDGARSFSFESYLSTLQKAFTDLEATNEAVAEERKVRILMRGITASNMQTPVATVQANAHLKTNYEAAANYLSEACDNLKSQASARRNVSMATTSTKSAKAPAQKTKVSTKYLKHNDWWKLTDTQREAIRNKRRSTSTGNATSNRNSNRNQSVQAVVVGTPTDVSAVSSSTTTNNNNTNGNTANDQAIGAVMTRRNRGNNN